MYDMRQILADKLTKAFAPTRLEVIDESAQHAGHAGAREGGQSHFYVEIAAPAFVDMNRVARQRAVNAVLAEELTGQIHALRMKVDAG